MTCSVAKKSYFNHQMVFRKRSIGSRGGGVITTTTFLDEGVDLGAGKIGINVGEGGVVFE